MATKSQEKMDVEKKNQKRSFDKAFEENISIFRSRNDNTSFWSSQREIDERLSLRFKRKMHMKQSLIYRLGLEAELEGHNGCVNCLEWNDSGDLLASGSDDCKVILWKPQLHKKVHVIQSGHQGNIFSVKFLPHSNDSSIISGAADCKIKVHDVHGAGVKMTCSCHASRVKRLAVVPGTPNMFWSAAEDGLILQFDLRQKHQCSNFCNNVLINLLDYLGPNAEAKCIAINPFRPEQVAIGANDAYIRLYDRRMIKTTSYIHRHDSNYYNTNRWDRSSPEERSSNSEEIHASNLSKGCVNYFIPGHLPRSSLRRNYRTLACTYLAFSPNGSELLANLGGEQIYLFDIIKPEKPKTFETGLNGFSKVKYPSGYRNGTIGQSVNSVTTNQILKVKSILPPYIDLLKLKANEAFESGNFSFAINLYNNALSICPNAAVLYGNRAAAFMKRSWDGDIYAALRDCYTALQLDPNFFKAHYRLVRCLLELKWNSEANECLKSLNAKYPEHSLSHSCLALSNDINKALNKNLVRPGSECCRLNPYAESSDDSKDGNGGLEFGGNSQLMSQEREWRLLSYDFKQRFCGHCNTTTDIKEANFFGSEGQYIVAGSDDGSFFTWDRKTTNIVKILKGDESIVNCLQPHPTYSLLATSGIDPVVRLWSPSPEDGRKNDRAVESPETVAANNQRRMMANPLETMLINMGYRYPGNYDAQELDQEHGDILQCRTS